MSQQLQVFKSGSAFYDRRRNFFLLVLMAMLLNFKYPFAIVVIYFLNITPPFTFKEIYNVTCSVLLGVTVNTNTTDCHRYLPKENGK